MADGSAIEWTDATWNPVTGCTKISSGCDNCYASRFSERFRGVPGHPFETGFDLTLRPARLEQPLLWKRPRMDKAKGDVMPMEFEVTTAGPALQAAGSNLGKKAVAKVAGGGFSYAASRERAEAASNRERVDKQGERRFA